MTPSLRACGFALLAALALTACGRNGTGSNASAPATGTSPAVTPPGTTGSDTVDALGLSKKTTQPGGGTAGGLGGSSGLGMTGSFPGGTSSTAGESPGGSTNSTRSTSVGNR